MQEFKTDKLLIRATIGQEKYENRGTQLLQFNNSVTGTVSHMLLNKNELVLIYISNYLMFHNIHMYIVFFSFIDPERGGFGEIFPEVMILSLKEIFHRIPRAEGL